ncbi:MAG: hypothetical protein AB1689_27230 [Thermodesulfobacteriota bacterium]
MTTRSTLIGAAALAVALQACAAKTTPPPPPTVSMTAARTQGGGMAEETITVTATVQAIDQKTRMVTLLGPDGNTVTVRAGDEVKNLAQVKKGDFVTMVLYEAVAYEVRKKGTTEPGVAEAADVATAPSGARPAGVGAAAVTVTATIVSIDKKNSTVKLRGPEGNVVAVKVKDPSRLQGIAAGDLVEITYTHAVAISVDPAPKS